MTIKKIIATIHKDTVSVEDAMTIMKMFTPFGIQTNDLQVMQNVALLLTKSVAHDHAKNGSAVRGFKRCLSD